MVVESQTRIKFLNQMSLLLPKLESNKNIFYITGDTDYYIVGNKVPFQQGMGYTLMVWYYHTGKIPKDLINENFLWELNSQGYKEIDNKGKILWIKK